MAFCIGATVQFLATPLPIPLPIIMPRKVIEMCQVCVSVLSMWETRMEFLAFGFSLACTSCVPLESELMNITSLFLSLSRSHSFFLSPLYPCVALSFKEISKFILQYEQSLGKPTWGLVKKGVLVSFFSYSRQKGTLFTKHHTLKFLGKCVLWNNSVRIPTLLLH